MTKFLYFTRDKAFHHSYWPFFITIMLQSVITIGVNLLDNVMLGGYSEASLAGVAAVNQIQFILMQIIGGAGDGLVVLCSQYWGLNLIKPIQRLTSIALWLSLGIAVILFTLVSIFPVAAVRVFTNDPAIVEEGAQYLSVIKFTYPIFAISSILFAMLRSVQTVKIAVGISLSTLCVNGVLNYTLIYGNFGAPVMGSRGAAIATLTSRCVELAIVIYYLAFKDKKIMSKLKLLLIPDETLIKDYFKISVPTLIIGLQWGLNVSLQTVILGHMTAPGAIAANSVAVNLVMFLKVIAIASASAAGVIIGKAVGEGKIEKVKEYARTLQIIFLGVGVVSAIGILLLRAPVLSLYNISPQTKDLAFGFLNVLAITTFCMSYQMPVLGGIVRGGGDTRFVMLNDLISVWIIVIPISYLAAFVFQAPPIVVVACLNSDQAFKCLPAFIKVKSYNWIKRLTRT
ncbi:MAG: MATE family efflux transporter [Clostridiales bacterium]|jgi:putative MATE family efflux protein|nr:MATE family efflux transporter [Clostridiales bacterium]